jgi:hypothetical protein
MHLLRELRIPFHHGYCPERAGVTTGFRCGNRWIFSEGKETGGVEPMEKQKGLAWLPPETR